MKKDFVTDAIFDINKILKVEIEREFKHLNIGVGQLQILMRLYENEGHRYRQTELVESLGIDKSNASRNLAKLEQKGLIEIHHINKRDKAISLSESSIEYKKEIITSLQNISSKMISGVTEEELLLTYKILSKMKGNLH